MPEVTDLDLLQDYSRHASEAAFALLVQRQVNLVYSTALRQVGIPAQAEEIAQAVFVILARKAGGLRPDTVLEAWLYETTRLVSLSFLRGERRRQFREQEAYMQSTIQEPDEASTWSQLAPLLDDAVARLGKKDREAVVLRFFKEKNLRDVALAMNVTEAAAQSRVHRALEKLRGYFSKCGVHSTTAIISSGIAHHSVHAAPIGLANTISAVAVVKGTVASASTLTLVKGALKLMAWTKVKTAIAAGVGILLAAGTATVTVKEIHEHRMYSWQVQNTDNLITILNRTPPQVTIVQAKFPGSSGWAAEGDRQIGIGQTGKEVLEGANYGNFDPLRTVILTEFPSGKYDFIANLPKGSEEALQTTVKEKFGIILKHEMRKRDVLVLGLKQSGASGFISGKSVISGDSAWDEPGHFSCTNRNLHYLTSFLEDCFAIPIVDQTQMKGRFNIDLKWDEQNSHHRNLDGLREALLDQLGLELVPTNMPIQMLVVEKAN